MAELLKIAELALLDCVTNMNLDASVLRKERAVGIVPGEGRKLAREQLEETVLVTQKILVNNLFWFAIAVRHWLSTNVSQEMSPVGRRLPFCAFNGMSPSSRSIYLSKGC